jgi:hypothetical protein
MEVSPLARGVMLPGSVPAPGATPIHPITGRPSLPPSSCTRRPTGGPYGTLSPVGEGDGLTTFRVRTLMG